MIRRATNDDCEQINALGLIINSNFKKLFKIKDIIKEKYSKIFVYEEENRILGFLHVTELYESVDIINIVVDNYYQRKGIATNLIDYMLSDIGSKVKLITLEVDVNNIKALNLYQKMGFEIINTRKHYYGNNDAYLMGKGIN